MTRAARVAFLIDGADYFRLVTEAMARTSRTLFMVSWDVDSRTRLPWRGQARHRVVLAGMLRALLERRAQLQVRILAWRRTLAFAFDREWFATRTWARIAPGQLRFHADGDHPLRASHHQKYLVLDDRVAFSGGLDVTKGRWDTPKHRANDPRRRDFRGRSYPPFHDVQVVIEGEPAARLGEMFRGRWYRATGEQLPPAARQGFSPWPPDALPWVRDVSVAIARNLPASASGPPVREVEQLYLDAIAAARRHIYIENQYFTHAGIAAALAARLREPDGPEVVIVVPRTYQGRTERVVMLRARACLVRRLRLSDAHGRLAFCYPQLRGESRQHFLKVHAKVMIVDDTLALIGSANINNRSMSIDTECDLAIESGVDEAAAAAIRRLREVLLAEHLDVSPAEVADTYIRRRSLIAVVAALTHGDRRLIAVDDAATCTPPVLTRWLGLVVDPGRSEERARRMDMRRVVGTLLAAGLLLGMIIGRG